MKKETKKHIKNTLIGLLIAIILYFFLGSFFNFLGMHIYFDTDNKNISADSNGNIPFDISLANNNPLALPFVNPLYYYSVNPLKGNISCTTSNHECYKNSIDLGRIESGNSKILNIKIIALSPSNFSIEVAGYLNTFNVGILKQSIKINCLYLRNNQQGLDEYSCIKD